jgi:hypothetical protein
VCFLYGYFLSSKRNGPLARRGAEALLQANYGGKELDYTRSFAARQDSLRECSLRHPAAPIDCAGMTVQEDHHPHPTIPPGRAKDDEQREGAPADG